MPSKEAADEYAEYEYDDEYAPRAQRRPRRAEEIEYDEDSSVCVPASPHRLHRNDTETDVRVGVVDNRPSCTHALKQQWRAVSLRLRFGVFHVQRRLATAAPRRRTL